jgi:hypothetical protein
LKLGLKNGAQFVGGTPPGNPAGHLFLKNGFDMANEFATMNGEFIR